MSSSLDDLEPYEAFQQELDDYARAYKAWMSGRQNQHVAEQHSVIIHTFIEFVCFVKSVDSFEALNNHMVWSEYPAHFLNHYGESVEVAPETAISDFLLFINHTFSTGNASIQSLLSGKK